MLEYIAAGGITLITGFIAWAAITADKIRLKVVEISKDIASLMEHGEDIKHKQEKHGERIEDHEKRIIRLEERQ